MTRLLLSLLVLLSCNVTSKVPYGFKGDEFDFYHKKAVHYATKYDTMNIRNEFDSGIFIMTKIYYGIKAEENMNHMKRLNEQKRKENEELLKRLGLR